MSEEIISIYPSKGRTIDDIATDKYTEDHLLKYKLRTVNLVKYNPNHFTNPNNFLEIFGGNKSIATTLFCGFVGFGYRFQANRIRHVKGREGVWFLFSYTALGLSLGVIYSFLLFSKTQVLYNDYCAHFLFKRYKGSRNINRANIYHLKDVSNEDEQYYFAQSFLRNAHL